MLLRTTRAFGTDFFCYLHALCVMEGSDGKKNIIVLFQDYSVDLEEKLTKMTEKVLNIIR